MYTLLAYEAPENYRAQKCVAIANHSGVKIGLKHAPIPASDAFKRNCSPLGGNPVLETPEGHIFETNAICRFLARKATKIGLYGKTDYETAQIDAWLDFTNAEFDPLAMCIYGLIFGTTPLPECWLENCDTVFASIESWLETRTYLVGERQTIADISLAFTLQIFYRRSGHGQHFAEKFPNVFRLYNSVVQQPQAIEAIKTVGGSFGVPAERI